MRAQMEPRTAAAPRSATGVLIAVGLAVAVTVMAFGSARPAAANDDLVIFAAASLKNALDDVVLEWRSETGGAAVVSYGGSSALARQIEAGAPADLFVSANPVWMDALETVGLVVPESRRDLLGNRLVLIAHGTDAEPIAITAGFDLADRLGEDRLAMAMVDAVPAGIYGKAALESLGVWEGLARRVAQVDNVRFALALVARGEAPYGIVYATDASAEDGVTVVGTFPADSHPPIIYPVALVTDTDHPDASAFLDFISSDAARALFERHGFRVLD